MNFTEDDIEYLIGATGCDYDDAVYALQAANGDYKKAEAALRKEMK